MGDYGIKVVFTKNLGTPGMKYQSLIMMDIDREENCQTPVLLIMHL